MAYASSFAFLKRFTAPFYSENNATVIQEYFNALRHLVSFHDPELFIHMEEIGLTPNLFALSWFMTMFSHRFNLEKVYLIWDFLLTAQEDVAAPICFAFAVLQVLRSKLLHDDFNEVQLFLSHFTVGFQITHMNVGG